MLFFNSSGSLGGNCAAYLCIISRNPEPYLFHIVSFVQILRNSTIEIGIVLA
jgi:hypothetical protein